MRMQTIDRGRLLASIGFGPGKIPPDACGRFSVRIRDSRGLPILPADPFVTVSLVRSPRTDRRKSSAHRTRLACPSCNRWIPTGRFHQHYGTKVCVSAAR